MCGAPVDGASNDTALDALFDLERGTRPTNFPGMTKGRERGGRAGNQIQTV